MSAFWDILLSVSVPELYRRYLIQFFECPVEVFHVWVTDGNCDVLYRHIAVFQESARSFHTDIRQLLYKCFP